MIGILGGTFDPIHSGHLHIADAALARLRLRQIQFMPCATPVHRVPPRAGALARCAMIERAIAERPEFSLNRLEIERGGNSFTVDSLRELRGRHSEPLTLLLGGDAFNAFERWRQPDDILELANLAVCRRPGTRIEPGRFAARLANSVEAFAGSAQGAIIELEVGAPDCSSSDLRARLAAGEPVARWLHPAVLEYIEQQELYRDADD